MNGPREADVLPFPQAPEAVELRHLRSFVAVAEELNYVKQLGLELRISASCAG